MTESNVVDWQQAGAASDGKADSGKIMSSLLYKQFTEQLMDTAEVLTFGAIKYPSEDNSSWKNVPDLERRYLDALYRHLHAINQGEELDPESGKPHWAHVMCNVLFLWKGKQ